MKLACIRLYERSRKEGPWFEYCANIHDEWQMETKEEDGKRLGELAIDCIKQAAEELNFKVPLGGEYKLGLNWDLTH